MRDLIGRPPGGRRLRGRLARERRLDLAVGAAVLLAYAVVQLVLLLGPHPYDPAKYFATAVHFPDVPVDLWTLRIGLVGPVLAAVVLLGPSEAALYAIPLLTGLVLAAAVYATMLLLFRDRLVAAAAALVTVLNTSFLLNSSFIFPDTTATATFSAAFFCLVAGMRTAERDRVWATRGFVVFAGVFLGWTYLVREFSPVLLPVVLVAVWLLRYPLRRVALLAGAAAATAAIELVYGLVRYDQPFVHVNLLLGRRDTAFDPRRAMKAEHIQAQLDDPLDAILVFPRLVLAWDLGWLLLLLVAIFAVSVAWLRDRRLWLLAAWCLGFWAFMAVAALVTLPSGRWLVNVTNIRYWYPILPALAMGAFGGLYLLGQRFLPAWRGALLTRMLAVGLAVITLAPGFVEFDRCADRDIWRNDPSERWEELRSWFAGPESGAYDIVFTDRLTHRLLPAYTRTTFGRPLWSGRLSRFPDPPERLVRDSARERSLILIHKDRYRPVVESAKQGRNELRTEWFPVFVSDDGAMVLLAPAAEGGVVDPAGAWWSTPERSPASSR